jgi:hypothetical protein
MFWRTVTVAAAVGAAAVGIEAVAEGNVGAVVLADDGAGVIDEVVGANPRPPAASFFVPFEKLQVVLDSQAREAMGRVDLRTSPPGDRWN